MADSPPTIYTSRPDTTLEAELNVLANVYRFILDCHAKKIAAEPDSCNDAAIVRNTEGVSHVDQRPDRPSEMDNQRLLSPIRERTPKPGLSSRRV